MANLLSCALWQRTLGLAAVLCTTALLAAAQAPAQAPGQAPGQEPAPASALPAGVKLRPVRSHNFADSTYARNYRLQRYLLEAIQVNRPLSWIAAGGEFSPRHKVAAPAADTRPEYLFTSYLSTTFVVVGQPRWAFTIDPNFMLRMRRGGDTRASYPVRTPSYHVGGNLYFRTRMQLTAPPVAYGDSKPTTPPDPDLHYQYLRLGLHHHSNGQQGEAFVNGAPNELNGNFANNAVEATYVFGARTTRRAWTVAPFLSYGLPRLAEPTQRGRYLFRRGGVRLTQEVFSSWRRVLGRPDRPTDETPVQLARRNKSRLFAELNFSAGFSNLNQLPTAERGLPRRLNAEGTLVYIPRFTSQTGLFVTVGYYGEDPYNIQYLHRYPFVRAGIATAAFRNVTELLR